VSAAARARAQRTAAEIPVKPGWNIAIFVLIALIMAMAIAALHKPARAQDGHAQHHDWSSTAS
jgi:hypothetical protein